MYANIYWVRGKPKRKKIIERQKNELSGGRFNFILHSKNQAHDFLSRCLNLTVQFQFMYGRTDAL